MADQKAEQRNTKQFDPLDAFEQTLLSLLDLKDINEILERIRVFFARDLAYKDMIRDKIWFSSKSMDFKEKVRLYPIDEIKRIFFTYSYETDDGTEGILILNCKKDSLDMRAPRASEKIFLNLALRVLHLTETSYEEAALQLETIHKTAWEELLRGRLGDGGKIRELLKKTEFPLDRAILVFTFSLYSLQEKKLHRNHNRFKWMPFFNRIQANFNHILFYFRNEIAHCALPIEKKQNEYSIWQTVQYLVSTSEKNFSEKFFIYTGASSIKPSIFSLKEAYNESLFSLSYSLYNKNKVAFWNELNHFKLIAPICQTTEATSFIKDWVEKVFIYDGNNNTNYFETLETLDKNEWNMAKTAKALHCHINTIKYRIKKILHILNMDLNDHDFRFNIGFSLRIMRSRQILDTDVSYTIQRNL
jgi:purine catabolism regulator